MDKVNYDAWYKIHYNSRHRYTAQNIVIKISIDVGLHDVFSAMDVNCVIKPNCSRLSLRPRRLNVRQYHARFRAISVK